MMIYKIINNQYQSEREKIDNIEKKAMNIILIAGVILGLEFNLFSNLSENIFISAGHDLYYSVARSTSFFISTIILGIFTLILSRWRSVVDLASIIKRCAETNKPLELILNVVSYKLFEVINEENEKNNLQSLFLYFSFFTLICGVITATFLFFNIIKSTLFGI